MSIRLLARTLASLSLCSAAMSASAYSDLFVFGDSLSDSGNNALLLTSVFGGLPPVVIDKDNPFSKIPSADGTYTNGKVWTQYLAQALGLTLTPSKSGGNNFAYGGAQTGIDGSDLAPAVPGFPFSMRHQLNDYLDASSHHADPNALYIVAGGGNNVRAALEAVAKGADPVATGAATVSAYVTDMTGLVADLKLAGAQHVLVMNTPNFGLTPLAISMGASAQATALSYAMDDQLQKALTGSGVTLFDSFTFMTGVVAAGPASGFSDLTHACADLANACDVNTSLFWDGIHPTTLGHQRLAAAVLAQAVPEPAVAAMLALGLVIVALGARRRAAVQQG